MSSEIVGNPQNQIHRLAFDKPNTSAAHVDRDLFTEQNFGEGCAGKLAALVGIEDIGLAVITPGIGT